MNRSIDFNDLEWKQLNEFAREKTVVYGDRSVRLLELRSGFLELDWCVRGHVGYVIKGELEIQFDDRTEKFSEGDGLHIEFGEPHKALQLRQTTLLFLIDEG